MKSIHEKNLKEEWVMLILTRFVGEKIVIGDEDYFVEVVETFPSRGTTEVRMGIKASSAPQIVSPVCPGQKISIGKDILIDVVDAYPVRGRTQVRIGVKAPKEVSVHRLEIWEKIKNGESRPEPVETSTK